jgi:hypothetical protein
VSSITVADVVEADQPVTLSKHAYRAAKVSDADLTLNIEDFSRQVLMPQVAAVARYCENTVAGLMHGLTASDIEYDATNPLAALLTARKRLRAMGVPAGSDLFAVVGTDIAADLLASDKMSDLAAAGDTSALRDATLGKLAGFAIVESNLVTATDIVTYHSDAFALATVAPAVPHCATSGESMEEGGYALRHLVDYDAVTLFDRSIVSTLVGGRVNTLRTPADADAIPAIRIDAAE